MYLLERHIGRYFALKPGTKKAGMHRGEGYYPRDALAELHTADRYQLPRLTLLWYAFKSVFIVIQATGTVC